ncbi:MAG: hypothetical protein ACJ8DJ_03525 [Gemmatimonadales bacterium]
MTDFQTPARSLLVELVASFRGSLARNRRLLEPALAAPQAGCLRPDITMLNIDLTERGSARAARVIRTARSEAAEITSTGKPAKESRCAALGAGATTCADTFAIGEELPVVLVAAG